jgi:hypothetical protein
MEVMTLDTVIRGALERFIDWILEKEGLLEGAQAMFEKGLSPAVTNIEDALFGYVVGRIIQFIDTIFQLNYQRLPTNDESTEIVRMLQNRAMEIRSRIRLVANR